MRRSFVAGNWKMNKTAAEARLLMSDLMPGLSAIQGVEIVLCPAFTSILPVASLVEGTPIGVGAQDMYWEASGAFTGEVAPPMVAEFCKYVILGHSERRANFGDTDEIVNRKIKAAFAHGLIPIFCVGETLAENEANLTHAVVTRQLKNGLEGVGESSIASLVIAYEPVWAIGTGRAATAEDANSVIGGLIRRWLVDAYGAAHAEKVRIVYGGSVKASNAGEFFRYPDIDGALVGGASLKASEFISIATAAAR